MPRDLFGSVTAAPRRTASARLLPWSVALHVAVLATIAVAPLLATIELPSPDAALTYEIAMVKLPPAPASGSGRQTVRRSAAPNTDAAPLAAPTGTAPEPLPAATGLPDFPDGFGEAGGLPDGVPWGGPDSAAAPEPVVLPDTLRRVGGEISRPVKVHDVQPVYPELAHRARIEGIVIIDAVIGPDGRVRQARVLRSVPLLDRAALDAVRQWVFTPTRLNGEPVAVAMTITVQFSLR